MAILDPLHPLQSAVMEILIAEGPQPVSALAVKLKASLQHGVSRPNLYHLLRKLESAQLIVRVQGRVQVNGVWISHLLRLSDQLRASPIDSIGDISQLKPGTTLTYRAESLFALDPIWSHILTALTRRAKGKAWYAYNSHPWYSIGMRETEIRVYQSLVQEGVRPHMLYGNDTFLDAYGDRMTRVPSFRTMRTNNAPLPKEGCALWSCEDFVVECIMPQAISDHFAIFFRTVQAINQFDPQLFSDIFRMRAPCKVTVRNDPPASRRIRRIIEKFFEKKPKSTSS